MTEEVEKIPKEMREALERMGVPPEEFVAFSTIVGEQECDSFKLFSVRSLVDQVWSGLAMGSCSTKEDLPDQGYRDEANVLVAMSLRNNELLENLHAGSEPAPKDPKVSRLDDAEMRALMILTSRRLAFLLLLRDKVPALYQAYIRYQLRLEPGRWARNDKEGGRFVNFKTGRPIRPRKKKTA